jgi:NAD+ diphosphatase
LRVPVPRPPNVFAGPYLDRIAHRRKDDAWLEASLADPDSWLVPVWQMRSLVRHDREGLAAALLPSELLSTLASTTELVLLGEVDGRACFAVELEQPEAALALAGATEARFEDLRLAGALLSSRDAGVLAYARAMVYWRQRHRHCGVCGAPTVSTSAGHVMRCSNTACAADHFPRLDPAIIVLVTDGERTLLGRQAAWPSGRYSTIAGFVEPGESLEDAVAREVLEETGVRIETAAYHSSQPWPFPSSIMIGFTATATAGQLPRADEELEDARWFTREDVASGVPGLPPPQSISYRLIEDWFDAGSVRSLRETPGVRLWGAKPR